MPTLQNIPGSSSLSEDGVEVNVQIVNRTVEVRVANEFFEKTQIGRTDMSGTEAGQVPVWTGQAWDAGNVTWNSVQDLPAVIAAGDTQQDARDAIGLGTAAVADADDFATAAQGALADTALQEGDGLAALDSAASTKLAGIAAGATANDTDANLKSRANHTGTQLMASIGDKRGKVFTDPIILSDITDLDGVVDEGLYFCDLSCGVYSGSEVRVYEIVDDVLGLARLQVVSGPGGATQSRVYFTAAWQPFGTSVTDQQVANWYNATTAVAANAVIKSDGTFSRSTFDVVAALAEKLDADQVGVPLGAASLDASGKVPAAQLPDITITDTSVVASQAAMLALTAQRGDVAVRSDLNKTFILTAEPASTLANWQELLTPTDAVLSVGGKTGAVTLVRGDVGLGNVDNTSDANKPLSTAATAALAEKVTGPASAVGGNVAVFDGTSGKVVKDGGALGSAAYYPYATFAMNLLSDDGRFDGGTSNGGLSVSEANFNRGFFVARNGSTAASAGKFTFDSSTFGGAQPANTPTVTDLVNMMGLSGLSARRMAEFIVCEITSGTGTADPLSTSSGTMYLQNVGGLVANSRDVTAGFYIRAIDKDISIYSAVSNTKIIKNGIQRTNNHVISPSENWVFVLVSFSLTVGLYAAPPVGLYSTSGGKIQLAMPAFFHGTLPHDTVWKSPRITRIRL